MRKKLENVPSGISLYRVPFNLNPDRKPLFLIHFEPNNESNYNPDSWEINQEIANFLFQFYRNSIEYSNFTAYLIPK